MYKVCLKNCLPENKVNLNCLTLRFPSCAPLASSTPWSPSATDTQSTWDLHSLKLEIGNFVTLRFCPVGRLRVFPPWSGGELRRKICSQGENLGNSSISNRKYDVSSYSCMTRCGFGPRTTDPARRAPRATLPTPSSRPSGCRSARSSGWKSPPGGTGRRRQSGSI